MTLYKETLRRLSRIGITLFAVFFIVCTVMAVQSCSTMLAYNSMLGSQLDFASALIVYMYVGGIGLAFAGFSFLNRRADSDFYHSLPVSRRDLYLSVTAAALTWIVGTVFFSVLSVTVVHIVMGAGFVPLYPLMNFLYYTAGAALVFAAAAIAMSLTGTWFSASVVTGLVLFLPRYVLFLIARAIAVVCSGLINWVDFPVLLNPTYNAATSPIVLLYRPSLLYNLMSVPSDLYSLGLAAVELTVAGWLFARRKSELAEHGASGRGMQTAFACLTALPLLLLVFSGRLSGVGMAFSANISASVLIITLLSFACYLAYQMIVLKSWKAVLRALPWYVVTVAASFGVIALSGAYGRSVKNVKPKADDVAYVQFLPPSRNGFPLNYRALLVSDIKFDDERTITLVAENYARTLELYSQNDNDSKAALYADWYRDNTDTDRAAVKFVLKNGRNYVRNVLFTSRAELEAARRENPAYVAALGSFAPESSIRYLSQYMYPALTRDDIDRLRRSYEAEFPQSSLTSVADPFPILVLPSHTALRDAYRQQLGSYDVGGFAGVWRYQDSYSIVPEMRQTASLWMQLCNERADTNGYIGINDLLDAALDPYAPDWTYYNVQFTAFNLPISAMYMGSYQALGGIYPYALSMYCYGGRTDFSDEALGIARRLSELLPNGKPSNNPNALTLAVQYWATTADRTEYYVKTPDYLEFSANDQAEIVSLFNRWQQLSLVTDGTGGLYRPPQSDDQSSVSGGWNTSIAATPTPAPAPTPVPQPTTEPETAAN